MATRALAGIGWAGTYMTGLKLLADQVDAKLMSRATAGHAASIGISGALSFACADILANAVGWRLAFVAAGSSALVAWILVAVAVPTQLPQAKPPASGLYDFRPVFRNRSAMAYALAYCIHTLEMNALRGWAVAFLAYVAMQSGSEPVFSPAFVATAIGLIGTAASVAGNEVAIRLGRRKLIGVAMVVSIALGVSLGSFGPISYPVAVSLLLFYAFAIWLDSSSLTAGAAGTAEPSKRGATLAVHSMLGYAGGFVGPLVVGWVLDYYGGPSPTGWGAAFACLAAFTLLALVLFALMKPQQLVGDRAPA